MNILRRINSPLPFGHFHEDWTINVTFRVKNASPPGGHFHDYRTINVASRVLKRIYLSHVRKNAPSPGGQVFQTTRTIFEPIQDTMGTYLLTKFHEDRTINVASIGQCPAPWRPCFKATETISEFVQDIMGAILLANFHDDRAIIVASSGHVLQPNVTIFELVQYIIGTNLLTKCHTIGQQMWPLECLQGFTLAILGKKHLPPSGNVFEPTGTNFEVLQALIRINLLIKFHRDRTINVASRV
ncbi:hypothetical protein DPMN_015408 [Dreissena polymorpha]|uniref:Uncharacterized protein n=1 Tax=Dreissena polymorpha TaxID=45954 RepID=A0A9D4S3L2_DREPO|nr:hypothetical protein DPMN_015408 [Dreissena polymorpha]